MSAHAQYAAFASAVNLRRADLPGFAAVAREHHSKSSENESQYQRCTGTKEIKALFNFKSENFKSGGGLNFASASSEVQIMPSVAAAGTELAILERTIGHPAVRSCLVGLFDAQIAKQDRVVHVGSGTVHVTISDTKLAPMQLGSVAGTERAFGLSISMKVTYTVFTQGRSVSVPPVTLDIDVLGFASARAQVTLNTMSFGKEFSPQLESKLFMLLVSRASAAGHSYPDIES